MPLTSVMPPSVRSVLTGSENTCTDTRSDISNSMALRKLENNSILHPLPDLLNIKAEQDSESVFKPKASGNKDPHFDYTDLEEKMDREEVDLCGVVPDIVGPPSDITNRLKNLDQSPCKASSTPRKPSTPASSVFSCNTPGQGICGDTSATDVR